MQTGHGNKLSRRQEQALAALLTEPTIDQAARAAGVHPQTIKNWLKRPEFAAAFAAARGRLLDEALDRLQAITRKAVDTLEACLHAAKDADKIKAALGILDYATKARELRDLQTDLEQIKATLRGSDHAAFRTAPRN